jgi:hypothetical protein
MALFHTRNRRAPRHFNGGPPSIYIFKAPCGDSGSTEWTSEMPEEQANVEPAQDIQLFTRSDEWLARFLGGDLQIAMLRLFGALAVFLVIGATAAHLASR